MTKGCCSHLVIYLFLSFFDSIIENFLTRPEQFEIKKKGKNKKSSSSREIRYLNYLEKSPHTLMAPYQV